MSTATDSTTTRIRDIVRRADFPLLAHYPDLHYLDSASTTQQPRAALQAYTDFSTQSHANPHRALYDVGAAATARYEAARQRVARFLAAPAEGVLFTANTTASLNLAAAIEGQRLEAGDEILVSVAEHHSNMLPWRQVAAARNAKVVWLENVGATHIDINELRRKVTARTKVVAVAHISNVLGSVAPLVDVVELAHRQGARVVIDAAQSVARLPLSVADVKADYVAFSGHKMYGPTGIGVLYAAPEHLAQATPVVVGGGMVAHVDRQHEIWHEHLPQRWEAGTPHVAGAVGMAAAIDFLTAIGHDALWRHEQALTDYALEKLAALPFVRMFGPGTARERAGIFTFQVLVGDTPLHSHDVVSIANTAHVALRGGQHCAEPLMTALGVADAVRASVAAYSTQEDIDAWCEALMHAVAVFSSTT